jgi:hypothetical protein
MECRCIEADADAINDVLKYMNDRKMLKILFDIELITADSALPQRERVAREIHPKGLVASPKPRV